VDPGSQVTGFGVVEKSDEGMHHIFSGSVRLTALPSLPLRLKKLHQTLGEIISLHRPTDLALEQVFAAKNLHSALVLGHVRGVVLLTAVEWGLEVFEYSPLEIKKAVTGYGRAEKNQVSDMVQVLLGIPTLPNRDVSDALAAAICHLNWVYPLKR
jgi:crossover junction endodeoxyribonuclease RuvC